MAPSQTTYCAYCVKNIKNISRHIRRMHPGQSKILKLIIDKEQKCPHCLLPLSYSKRPAFLYHVRSCYLNPGRTFRAGAPFRCPFCSDRRKFSQQKHLTRHLKLKHGPDHRPSAAAPTQTEVSEDLIEKIYELIDGKLDPALLIDFMQTEKQSVKRLQLDGARTRFKFTELCRQLALHGFFLDSLSTVFKYLLNVDEIRDNYLVGISLESPSELEYPIPMPLMLGKHFKIENFLNQIENTIQSHSDLGLNSDMVLNVVTLPNPSEAGSVGTLPLNPRKFATLIEFLQRKRGIFDPTTLQSTYICFLLCIALGVVVRSRVHLNQIMREKRKTGKLPKKIISIVSSLYDIVGITSDDTQIKLSINVFELVQLWLTAHHQSRLVIHKLFSDKVSDSIILFSGPNAGIHLTTVRLLVCEDHCFLITSENFFFGKPKKIYCRRCYATHFHGALCDLRCRFCLSQLCANLYPCNDTLRRLECDDCLRPFKNKNCFETHKKLNVCNTIAKCPTCHKTMKKERLPAHACLLHRCRNCSEFVEADHKCFIQPIIHKNSTKVQVYIFFDIESMPLADGSHEPNVVVCYRCCNLCIDQVGNMEPLCCMRGNRKHVFIGQDCIEQLIKFMFYHPENANAIAIAHYGSGYDFCFVLKTLLELGHRPSKLYCRNLRILQLTAGLNVTLKDSYLWFSCKLRKLSDLWTISVRKSYFNHTWNSREKLDYSGPWPSIEEFGISAENEDYQDFLQWYGWSRNERPVYCMLKELIAYCEVDVNLLYQSCQKFRSMVLTHENVDPFKVSMSIASLTAYVYRHSYLPLLTLPLILDKDSAAIGHRQQSKIAMKYLSWLVETRYPNLIYAGNGVEYSVWNYKVDGFDRESNTIIEVFGDVVHGCPKHTYPDGSNPLKLHLTNNDVHDNSMAKICDLLKLNYRVQVVWECEIMQQLKENSSMKEWFEARQKWKDLVDPINSRDALHGGRVEAFVLLVELSEEMIRNGWRINHLDVVSLYPFVHSDPRFYYPTSHPIVINGCELKKQGKYPAYDEIVKYFGIISAICYGPGDLLIPVLPVKHPENGRLIFPLCGVCAFQADTKLECNHSGEERAFQGCWTSPELLRAMELGYTIVKIKQIWHFEHKSNTIFKKYITNWLGLKYASSGWPEECDNDDRKKLSFLEQLQNNYGIKLGPKEIEKNVAKRTMSKHFLNNLWGKLSTRLDKVGRKIEFISTPEELAAIMKDSTRELVGINAMTSNYAIVETIALDHYQYSAFHNPVLASFVCSYGRLCLLEHLLKPNPSHICYTDTDSIVYLANINEPDPFEHYRGDMLGMLKTELKSAKDFIIKWVSLGSKNYAYVTAEGHVTHKTKGLVVNSLVEKQFNFTLLKSILLKDNETIRNFYDQLPDQELAQRLQTQMFANFPGQIGVLLPQPTITRNFKKNQNMKNEPDRTKLLRFTFTKRKIVDNNLRRVIDNDPSAIRLRSVPWGFGKD